MGWIVFFLILFTLFTFFFIRSNKETNKDQKKRNEIKSVFNNHEVRIGQYLIDDKGTNGLGLDDNGDFVLINNYGNSLSSSLIKPQDIMEVSIVEDGSTIIKASRGSQIGGALIGGVIAGGVGAIIGGLSGKKTKSTKVKKIILRIILNNQTSPIRNVCVLDHGYSIDTNSPTYKVMSHRALEWQKKIEIAVNKTTKVTAN